MLYYKINVLQRLKEKGYNQTWLHDHPDCGIGQSAVIKLRKGEMIGFRTLGAICGLLDMQPGEIIGYEPGYMPKIEG